jgi:hypothetical protein
VGLEPLARCNDGLQLGTPIAPLTTLIRDHPTAAMAQFSWSRRLDDVRVPERVLGKRRDAVAPSEKGSCAMKRRCAISVKSDPAKQEPGRTRHVPE